MNKKIKTQSQILTIVKSLKKEGKKIVTYNGSFDILHAGHVQAVSEAKKQGDVLVILLNSDASIKMYKGPFRPINQERDRAEMLAGLGDVDYVVLFHEINPKNILARVGPDVHCNGSDWGKNCVERGVVEQHGGKIHILKWKEGFSTSNIIKKIRATESRVEIKAVFLDADSFGVSRKSIAGLLNADYKVVMERLFGLDAVVEIAEKSSISLSKSWLIGRNQEDVILGRETNVKTIKIGDKMPAELKLEPNYYAKDLQEAVQIILQHE